MQNRVVATEVAISSMESRIAKLEESHVDIRLRTSGLIGPESVTSVGANYKDRRIAVDEEAEARKNNIILYRVDESDSDDTAVRIQHDTTFVHNLLREVLEINVNSDDIGKIIRLGKRSDDGRNRPVLIGLKTDELKNRVMNNLGKLKNANEVYKKVSVAHDLSPAQRESVRNAVEEKKETAGLEWLWGGKLHLQSGRESKQNTNPAQEERIDITRLPDALSCLYLNARSIVNKIDDLFALIESWDPDVIGICESWANASILDSELSVAGYDLFRKDRPHDIRGGGVMLYVKAHLQAVEFMPNTSFPSFQSTCGAS